MPYEPLNVRWQSERVSETYADRRDPDGSVGLAFTGRAREPAADTVPAARIRQGDMVELPIMDGVVDAVTACHAAGHVDRTLRQLRDAGFESLETTKATDPL